jgi:glycosyltransferase involved in cell wall biosynthesis
MSVTHDAIKAAIIFINYGPYHLARARALLQVSDLQPTFIQLAGSTNSHPWHAEGEAVLPKFRTLSELPYEKCGHSQLARALRETLDDINPNVVVTASYRPFTMLTAARWARSHGKRAVLFHETTQWDRSRHPITEMLKRWTIASYYDAAFAGGKAHRDYLMRLGMPDCRIWQPYDVVDNDYFAEMAACVRADRDRWRERLGLPERYFLYVGRYAREKNLLSLLEAYHRYRASYPQGWPFVLVGHGPERENLQRFVTGNRITDVLFKPFAQIEEIPAYYALAGCFVLASTVDPWGLVVNEAMACGLPVLVSRLCGCSYDLVREKKNGFLFDPYDIDALAALLGRMSSLNEAALQEMSAQSRSIISAFTPEIWAAKLAQCIRAVVRNSGSDRDIGAASVDHPQCIDGRSRESGSALNP